MRGLELAPLGAKAAGQTSEQAPLAQSAERLHGKYLARIGVLTSENAS
jgi:hypothetical protein